LCRSRAGSLVRRQRTSRTPGGKRSSCSCGRPRRIDKIWQA
jgi:hypothetical protein